MHSTSKKPQKRTLKISLRHLLVNLKNARVLAPPMLFGIELWRQWQPLMFPPSSLWRSPAVRKARAPQGSSSGQELQNNQNSAIALRDANTSMRAFERFTGSTVRLGWMYALIWGIKLTPTQDRFGRYAAFRKAFPRTLLYRKYSLVAAEKTIFFQKDEKKTYRIIIWPARPLNSQQ